MFGLRIFLIYPYTDSRCYVDTKEFIDAFKFDTKLVYAVLVVSCYKDYEVYFTEDDRHFYQMWCLRIILTRPCTFSIT